MKATRRSRLSILLLAAVRAAATGCSAHSPMKMKSKTDTTMLGGSLAPHGDPVFVTKISLHPERYDPVAPSIWRYSR